MSLSSQKNNTARLYNDKSKSKPKKKLIKKDIKIPLYDYALKLYKNFFAQPNQFLLNQLKGENLSLILNNLSPTDILILNEIFNKYFAFKQIEILPYTSLKQEITNNKKNKLIKENIKENKEKQVKLKEKIDKLFIGISKHLTLSNNLISLSISNFELYSKYTLLISKGLSTNKSLKSLKISNCLIQLTSFETLIKSLFNHQNISNLDLSNNNLSDKFGNIISKLITKQAQRRDQIIWSYGLRNENPPSNYKTGLISINLSGNKLSNESAECLIKVLSSDQYLRAVHLNNNKITNEFCKRFIYMMRKNMSLLTIDLRNNPGYDEYIHSRIVMKMAKNMRYLYQQYKKGEFSEEEFENFKEFIDATFFDVDIPQDIVEFYNNNLPETLEDNNEKNNNNVNNIEQIEENKVKINNIIDDEEKKEILLMNRQLSEENLMLKKQIKELKMKNIGNNQKNNEKENDIYKKTESDIESYYSRVEELISELNDIMNKIEKKQGENKSKSSNISENNTNIKINNNNAINNYISKKEEEKFTKKEDDNKILNKLHQKNINNQSFPQTSHKLFEEKKGEEEKINININNNNKINNEKIQEKNLEPIPYKVMNAEPSERNRESSEENENSHYEDEEGNIYNVDDLTNEEKMLIIQQKIILQKLQEEAEARGEQFNPQEYIEFLERQAMEEEEEDDDDLKESKKGNKLNKSF
jgi:hypothetical protein